MPISSYFLAPPAGFEPATLGLEDTPDEVFWPVFTGFQVR
jgi:hypothetical protein